MRHILLIATFVALAGCSSLVRIGVLPADKDAAYFDTYRRNTRTVKAYDEFATQATICLTQFTPSFIDAYLATRKTYHSSEDFEQLRDREQSLSDQNIRFFASVYAKHEHLDLDQPKSIWQVYVVRKDGSRVPALSIKKWHEPATVVSYFFPCTDAWSEPYHIQFPRTMKDGALQFEKGEPLTLVFQSVVATVTFNVSAE